MALSVRDAVEVWKARPPRPTDIPLETACTLIDTDEQPFEAKRTGPVEWVLCRAGEDTPAIFSYAAIFAGGDPPDTGNLLRPANEDDAVLPENSRFERVASFKCNYSYAFDTSQDPGLFGTQSIMDAYMESVPGFNTPFHKPRKLWQSGSGPSGTNRFWMRVPMFLKLRDHETKGEPPAYLHEWVREADRKSRMYRANPCRPSVLSYDGQVLRDIKESDPPELVRGDGVALTFSISYIVGHRDWYPTYALIDVVRIASERSSPLKADDGRNMVVLRPPRRIALRPGDALNGDMVDEWEIEDLHMEDNVVLGAGAPRDPNRNKDIVLVETLNAVVIPPVEPDQFPGRPSDSMDVDDTDMSRAAAAEDSTFPESNGRGKAPAIRIPRRVYSPTSAASDESSRWSDSAVEDGPPPPIDRFSAAVHSDGDDVATAGRPPSAKRLLRTRK